MKKQYWSDNEKYIVMLSSKNASVRGVRHGYQAFLDYKHVKAALNVISNSGDSYTYNGNIYSTPITSSRAFQILGKIERCEWDEDIITVAKQIGANRMLSPRG